MQREKPANVARRRRHVVTSSRLAAWLGFSGAVLSQAAILAVGYHLTDPASPDALRNAGVAGFLAVVGLVLIVGAKRTGKRAQSSTINLGRLPLRLIDIASANMVDKTSQRPAA